MKKMLEPLQIRQKMVKNRVVFPPAVYFDNITNYEKMDDRRLAHYARIARGGVGMIIVEATCIDSMARLTPGQLGLWEDTQIASMQQICERIHRQDVCVCIQLHHGGGGTDIAVAIEPIVPSAYSYQGRNYREATEEDLYRIRHQFVAAALRAKKAGADGIELHGAHGYFLSQMASPLFNKRTDAYGGNLENRLRLACECIRDIRTACGPAFIIGYRMGGYEPGYAEGIAIAKQLEKAGVDYLHVSWGNQTPQTVLEVPHDFHGNAIVYSAACIKKEVSIPVIAVNDIRSAENGEWLLANGHADMVAYCRPILATPEFTNRMQQGEKETDCLFCKTCFWFHAPEKCPGRIRCDQRN